MRFRIASALEWDEAERYLRGLRTRERPIKQGRRNGFLWRQDMIKTVFVAECRITNKEQTIDKEDFVPFTTLKAAKYYINKGLDEWDGTGKGIANGQVSEEERDYNDKYVPINYDLLKRRVHSPLANGKWYKDEWQRG